MQLNQRLILRHFDAGCACGELAGEYEVAKGTLTMPTYPEGAPGLHWQRRMAWDKLPLRLRHRPES
jgi:hypothetical protein